MSDTAGAAKGGAVKKKRSAIKKRVIKRARKAATEKGLDWKTLSKDERKSLKSEARSSVKAKKAGKNKAQKRAKRKAAAPAEE